MRDSILTLRNYLEEIGARHVRIEPNPDAHQRMPVYLGNRYKVYDAQLFGKSYCLLHDESDIRPSPTEAAKHAEQAGDILGKPVVFLFASLPSFERQRLIRKGVAFLVPHHQVYLPMALVDLRKRSGPAQSVFSDDWESLSAPAQVLLLFHLQHHEVEDWSLSQWAERLQYSPSSMTRVRRDLENAGLCRTKGSGKSRVLHFDRERHVLWKAALPYLRSPVRSRHNCRLITEDGPLLLRAGLSALAERTMLAPDATSACALSSSAYQAAVKGGLLKQHAAGEPDTIAIERWRYAPAVLSQDGEQVDNLSLYLSLKDSPDERVQGALNEMLEAMTW